MPYSSISELPQAFKVLPEGAQKIAMNVINSVLRKGGGEEDAMKQAWGAVKNSFQQDAKGNWVKKQADGSTYEVETLHDVDLLAVGTWKGEPSDLTIEDEADLDGIVVAFNEMRANPGLNYDPPVKLGHDEGQKLIQRDGMPAVGWIRGLKRVGRKLVASVIEDVPAKVAELIKAGAYKYVSSEIYEDYKVGEKTYPFVLRAVSLLGGDVPAVKSINDILNQYQVTAGENETVKIAVMLAEQEDTLSTLLSKIDAILAEDGTIFKGKVGAPAIRTYLKEVRSKLKGMIGEKSASESEATHPWEGSLDQTAVNKLPDSSFAVIEAGGTEDAEGKTTPRSLRHFPYKNAEGKVDVKSLEDSLAVVAESGLSLEAQKSAMAILRQAAQSIKKEDEMEKELRAILKLDEKTEENDILVAVRNIVNSSEAKTKQLAEQTATALVDQAIADNKLAPALQEWAKAYALKDPEGFKSYTEGALAVVELGERGKENEESEQVLNAKGEPVKLSDMDKSIAKTLGISEKDMLKSKAEEVE